MAFITIRQDSNEKIINTDHIICVTKYGDGAGHMYLTEFTDGLAIAADDMPWLERILLALNG